MSQDTSEKLFIALGDGVEAVVSVEIKTRQPGIDRPQRRKPTVKELHHTAEALVRRIYQFSPDPTIE